MSRTDFKPGKLYQYRKDIEVDCFVFYLESDGRRSSCYAFEVEQDVMPIFIREYDEDGNPAETARDWGVFLFGDQAGVAMKKYFKRAKSQ